MKKRYTADDRLQILAEVELSSAPPGHDVREVARKHGLNFKTLYRWMRESHPGAIIFHQPIVDTEQLAAP